MFISFNIFPLKKIINIYSIVLNKALKNEAFFILLKFFSSTDAHVCFSESFVLADDLCHSNLVLIC